MKNIQRYDYGQDFELLSANIIIRNFHVVKWNWLAQFANWTDSWIIGRLCSAIYKSADWQIGRNIYSSQACTRRGYHRNVLIRPLHGPETQQAASIDIFPHLLWQTIFALSPLDASTDSTDFTTQELESRVKTMSSPPTSLRRHFLVTYWGKSAPSWPHTIIASFIVVAYCVGDGLNTNAWLPPPDAQHFLSPSIQPWSERMYILLKYYKIGANWFFSCLLKHNCYAIFQ